MKAGEAYQEIAKVNVTSQNGIREGTNRTEDIRDMTIHEARGARAAIIHYENAYQKRVESLEAAEADIKKQLAELQKMKNNEKSLIARKAKEIATPKILLAERDRDNAKAEMKYRHEEDMKNLKKWLLFLFAYSVSMTMLMVGLYASEVLNKTSRQLILTTVGIHALYLCVKVQRDT